MDYISVIITKYADLLVFKEIWIEEIEQFSAISLGYEENRIILAEKVEIMCSLNSQMSGTLTDIAIPKNILLGSAFSAEIHSFCSFHAILDLYAQNKLKFSLKLH